MTDADLIWNDEPGGNVEHLAEHGITPDEFEDVFRNRYIDLVTSDSSDRPCKFGWTRTGKHIIVVWEVVWTNPDTVLPVTAYEVDPRD